VSFPGYVIFSAPMWGSDVPASGPHIQTPERHAGLPRRARRHSPKNRVCGPKSPVPLSPGLIRTWWRFREQKGGEHGHSEPLGQGRRGEGVGPQEPVMPPDRNGKSNGWVSIYSDFLVNVEVSLSNRNYKTSVLLLEAF